MFEAGLDQASGLRRLFGGAGRLPVPVLALGCGLADRSRHSAALAMAEALVRAGWNPLILDLLGPPDRSESDPSSSRLPRIRGPEAATILAGGNDLHEVADSPWTRRSSGFDVLLAVADPLHLARVAAGTIDRMAMLAGADPVSLARAYAQIKVAALDHGVSEFVVAFPAGGCRDSTLAAHERLARAASRFVGARVAFGGFVAPDGRAREGWDRLALLAGAWLAPIDSPNR